MGAVLDLFNVLHDPAAVFGRLKEKPRILWPFVALMVLLVIGAVFARPFQAAGMETIKAALPPEQAARMGSGSGVVGTAVGAAIFLAIQIFGGALLLWLGSMMLGGQGGYKKSLTVLQYSMSTFVLYSVVNLVALYVRGVGAVQSMDDAHAHIGLDILVSNTSLFLGAFLNGINPFSIWGVWLCGVGLSITQGVSRAGAIMVTALVYIVGLLLLCTPLIFLDMALKR